MGEAGFTLAEMLVVIAVVALAAGAGALAMAGRGPARMVASAADRVAAELRYVRLDAIRSGQPRSLIFDPAAKALVSETRPPFAIPDGLRLDLVTAREAGADGKAAILFLPDGRSSGGRVELAAGTAKGALVVDWLTGLVRGEAP
ncbi:hypothetical protein ASG43_06185 [Aureimonas sp. Leaf454]|nr:hypothetical protein ASG43_06185 [Aureimonas sp. Leaf454]